MNASIVAFQHLESMRQRLPQSTKAVTPKPIQSIIDIADDFDVFWFDAFGVLNAGNQAITGAIDCIAQLRQLHKSVYVVSNAASYPKAHNVAKLQRLGYDFTTDEVLTSRDALISLLKQYPHEMTWGLIAPDAAHDDLPVSFIRDDEPNFYEADGFLFVSAMNWDDEKQRQWRKTIDKHPRPILVGNPDMIAPQNGYFSHEPGHYTLTLPEPLQTHVVATGKPFAHLFDLVAQKTQSKQLERHDKSRILMIGDTLHTDILGGNAFGVKTALVTEHGFFKGLDYWHYIEKSGITPDFILPSI